MITITDYVIAVTDIVLWPVLIGLAIATLIAL